MEIYFAVIIFIALDIITGLAKALKNNGLNSSVLRIGLWHKSAEIMAIGGATAIEYYKSFLGLSDISILIPVATYICIMEVVSCIENLCELNPSLAKIFSPYLAKLNLKEKENNKNA